MSARGIEAMRDDARLAEGQAARKRAAAADEPIALGGAADDNFPLSGGKAISGADFSAAHLIQSCLGENERRLSLYDRRLLRGAARR